MTQRIPEDTCAEFLQWALPRLRMRWPGFRKVRRQVCRRIAERLEELYLAGLSDYKTYLTEDQEEWRTLDSFCRITISRFYRDRSTFRFLQDVVLKELAKEPGTDMLRCWCCGCAAGEEPYTLSLLWYHVAHPSVSSADLEIIATDSDDDMLDRAVKGRYRKSSIRELPEDLLQAGFTLQDSEYILKPQYRSHVHFVKQDVRSNMPDGPFHLILCRYLVFTYFDEKLQGELLDKILCRLVPGGALVLGKIDRLPDKTKNLVPWSEQHRIYRKVC